MSAIFSARPEVIDVGRAKGGPAVEPDRILDEVFGPEKPPFLGKAWSILSPLQKEGVTGALDRYAKGEEGYLIADGTGTGKGFQLLVLAALMHEKTGKPSLLVTKSADLERDFHGDASLLGIELGNGVHTAHFGNLEETLKQAPEWGHLAVDEAGVMPVETVAAAQAHSRAYASASPFSEVGSRHTTHILSVALGRPEEEIAATLGVEALEKEAGQRYAPGEPPRRRAANAIDAAREAFEEGIRQGAIVRREYPIWGGTEVKNVAETVESLRNRREILARCDQQIATQTDPALRAEIEKGREDELRHSDSLAKVDAAVAETKAALSLGHKVILYGDDHAKGANASFLGTLDERLRTEGVTAVRFREGTPQENQAAFGEFMGPARKIDDFVAGRAETGRPVRIEVEGGSEKDAASHPDAVALANRLRARGLSVAVADGPADREPAQVLLSSGHEEVSPGGEVMEERGATVLRVPLRDLGKVAQGRLKIQDQDAAGKGVGVILLPMAFAEGLNLNHATLGGQPRHVIQAELTTGADQLQIVGRACRGANTLSPSHYTLLYAPGSPRDRVQGEKMSQDLRLLEASGSAWATTLREDMESSRPSPERSRSAGLEIGNATRFRPIAPVRGKEIEAASSIEVG
jgi:hypothetical protein